MLLNQIPRCCTVLQGHTHERERHLTLSIVRFKVGPFAVFCYVNRLNDYVIKAIHDELEEHVEKNMFQVVEQGLDQAKDVVDGLVNKLRSILPEGGQKGESN